MLLRPLSQPSPPIAHAHVYVTVVQVPEPLHVPPGHAVPAGALPLAVHTGAPVVQLVVPVVQGLPVEHDAPGIHATQLPAALHTPPLHAVPTGSGLVALQTGDPVVHEIVPEWQAVAGVQAMPVVHALHVPLALQTPPVHAVPAGELPLAVQTGAPVVHEMVPVWQAVGGVHAIPLVQVLHIPLPLQTPPEQAVPAGALPLELHTGAPLEQSSVPV